MMNAEIEQFLGKLTPEELTQVGEALDKLENDLTKEKEVIVSFEKQATLLERYGTIASATDWPLVLSQTALPLELMYDLRRWEPRYKDFDEGIRFAEEDLENVKALVARAAAAGGVPAPATEAVKSRSNEELLQLAVSCEAATTAVPRNLRLAAECYTRLAAQGDTAAQTKIAYYTEFGLGGLAKDEPKAAALYEAAAKAGGKDALFHLGRCYGEGKGVAQDLPRSMACYKEAADKGHTEAQCTIAKLYQRGRGGAPIDVGLAQYYFSLAAAKRYTEAKIRLQDLAGE